MSASTHEDRIGSAFTGRDIIIRDRHFVAGPADNQDDPLKFSAAIYARIRGNCSVTGEADENGCDINNSSSVVVEGTLLLACGDQAPQLVKGGSVLITEGAGCVTIVPPPSARVDLLVDDWSDQSQEPSLVDARIVRLDGQPVRMAWGRWRRPRVNGPTKVDWPYTIGLHLYNPVKGFLRYCLRIRNGEKGPAWF